LGWQSFLRIHSGAKLNPATAREYASAERTRRGADQQFSDENGQPDVNGVPVGYQHDCRCDGSPGGSFVFDPSTVNISVGDTVAVDLGR